MSLARQSFLGKDKENDQSPVMVVKNYAAKEKAS
jgi:hypothetical protein